MTTENPRFAPKNKKSGDPLRSADWNAAMQEIVRLETAKINREGAQSLQGPLTIAEALSVSAISPPTSTPLEIKGALKLAEGVAVNQFSNDSSFSTNSDSIVPTQKAVKTYVDTQLNSFSKKEEPSEVLSVSAISPPTSTPLEIKGALKLAEGVAVNQFSADESLGENSDSIIATQKAVKIYVDAVTTTLDTALKTYVVDILSSPYCNPIIASLQNSAGMTLIVDGTEDDKCVQLPDIGFDFPFYDAIYRRDIYVSSNSYIIFGSGIEKHTDFSYTVPGRALLIDSKDRSYQRVYFKQDIPGKTCRIRFEGAIGTSGTPGSPSLLWETTLFSNGSIQLVTGVTPGDGYNFITDGTGNYHTDYKSNAYSSYVFMRQSSNKYTVHQGSYISLIPSGCS